MKNKYIFLFLLLLLNLSVLGQINKNGIPLIKNFSPVEYNAEPQNWAFCEDNRGVIFLGNTEGVIEFDGNNWNLIPLANGSIVNSLATSDEGTVFVGGVDEFGYLAPKKNGKMAYHSLSNQLDSINFREVHKTYTIGEDVYFCSKRQIYKYTNKKFVKEFKRDLGAFLSFKIDETIYWGDIEKDGLLILNNDEFVSAKGGEFYLDKDLFSMLPWSEKEILIATIGQGIYIYNTESGLSKSIRTYGKDYSTLCNLLDESQIYNGIKLSNGDYAYATLNNGCIIFNNKGNILYKLDKDNGLQDETIINLYESKNGILFLGLNVGIAYVEINTPIDRLSSDYGIEGIIIDVERFNELLYVSTTAGVFYLEFDDNQLPDFKYISVDDRSVWDLQTIKIPGSNSEKLWFASAKGVFENIPGKKPKEITEIIYESRCIYQSKINPKKVYLGYLNGIALIEYENGVWKDKKKLTEEILDEIRSITEDEKGNLWLGTVLSGVVKIDPDNHVVRYGLEEGLPDLSDNKVYYVDNQIICGTKKGIYYLNSNTNSFEKYNGFGEKYFSGSDEIRNIYSKNDTEHWVVLKDKETNFEYIERLKISQDRIVTIENLPFKRLFKNTFYSIEFDGDNGVWIAGSDAIYNYQESLNSNFSKQYNTLIRKIEMGIDSVVFFGTYYKDTANLITDLFQPDELIRTVAYKNNSFIFYFSTPFVPIDEIKYSYMLEGYEEQWSNWLIKTDKEYTNLNQGHYIFKVKAKNIYGVESEIASYEFTIRPPWYESILAYIFYFILGILVLIVVVKIYTRRLEQEKIRLEQIVKERTEEVVKQKDEIELQRDEIADKNRSITDSIKYAERIQKAILPSNDLAEEILPEHFILFRPRDIVSGDFYWMTKKGDNLVVIAADCTGHGVPGAFMSMLGVSFLNEIVNRHEVKSASDILNSLRRDIKKTLGQEGKEGEAKDGMDISLCIFNFAKMQMQYAGAYNPLYMFRDNELLETKADRMPIGIHIKEKDSFTNNEIDLIKGDVVYLFSDGFQDQFGGEDGQKFKTKNFKQLLLDIHQKPMAEQREILDTTVDKWRGKWEQVDDIIILGVRV